MTVDTRAALESMFKGALPHDVAWSGAEPTATLRLAEPTVTISTRAAFDAINSMFMAELPHEDGGVRRGRRGGQEEHTGALTVYEDTEFLPGGQAAGDQTEGIGELYQDTEFLTGRLQGGESRADQTENFLIYEDTDLLGGASTAGDGRRSVCPPEMDQENAFPPSRF